MRTELLTMEANIDKFRKYLQVELGTLNGIENEVDAYEVVHFINQEFNRLFPEAQDAGD